MFWKVQLWLSTHNDKFCNDLSNSTTFYKNKYHRILSFFIIILGKYISKLCISKKMEIIITDFNTLYIYFTDVCKNGEDLQQFSLP